MRDSSPYKTIAVATTFSPRFKHVLAEAKRIRDRFGAELHLIHVGKRNQETPKKFSDVLAELELPADSPIHRRLFWPRSRGKISMCSWRVRWRRRSCYIRFLAMSHVAWCERRIVQ